MRKPGEGIARAEIRKRGKCSAGQAASGTGEFLPHVLNATLRGGYPVMVGIRRVAANVFLMPTLQVGNPIAVHVHVKTDDLLRGAPVSRTHGLHGSIVRPLLRNAREFLVTAAALTCK